MLSPNARADAKISMDNQKNIDQKRQKPGGIQNPAIQQKPNLRRNRATKAVTQKCPKNMFGSDLGGSGSLWAENKSLSSF